MEARGRVSLPAPFRKVFAAVEASDTLVLLPAHEEHPQVRMAMTAPGYEIFLAEADEKLEDEEFDAFNEKYVGQALTLDVDDAGRFVLSPAVRDAMGLDGDVVFVGLNQHFELRHPEAHERRAVETASRADAAAAKVPKRRLHL